MKPYFPPLFVLLAIIVIVQLGYLMADVQQRRLAEESRKIQADIDHNHFNFDHDILWAKFKVDADFKPLLESSEELAAKNRNLAEISEEQLKELRLIRIKVERESDLLELYLKHSHEGW